MTNISLRKDIQSYARILYLMAQYDYGNENLIPSILRSFKRYFEKNDIKNKVQLLLFALFKELINTPILDKTDLLKSYLKQLKKLENNKFEKRSFIYLDSITWVESKIKNQAICEIIKSRNK